MGNHKKLPLKKKVNFFLADFSHLEPLCCRPLELYFALSSQRRWPADPRQEAGIREVRHQEGAHRKEAQHREGVASAPAPADPRWR